MVGYPALDALQNVLLGDKKRLKDYILSCLIISLLLLSANIAGASPPAFQLQDKSIHEDQLLTFTVSATDPDGDSIVYGVTGLPEGASFTDGSEQNAGKKIFSWIPGYDDAGTYPVSFSATDGTSVIYSNITITVINVNRDPILAVIGPRYVNENSLLTFTLSASDQDNDTLVFSSPNLPGSATIDVTSGVFQWVPSYDQAGIYQIEFVVYDGASQDSEYVTITVNNVNRPPEFTPIADFIVSENTLLEITLTASDPDNDVLVFTKNVPWGTISGNRFSWKPTYDDAGEYNIQFTVSDGDKKVTQNAKVTVNSVNRAPVLYSIPDVSAKENEQITLQLTAYDPDEDALTYHNVSALPAGAEFNTATGLFRWSSVNSEYLPLEFYVSDGLSYSAPKGVIIAVGFNVSPPEMESLPNQRINENEKLSFNVNASDKDNNALSYSMGFYPSGATLESTTGKFMWTPSYYDAGRHTIELRVSDDSVFRFTDSITAAIEVVNVNRAPEITSIPAKLASETQTLQMPLTAADPDGDSLMFMKNVSFGTIRGNTFIWTPGYSDYGIHYVQFTASDGSLSASTTATIIVDNTNMPPKFDTIGSKDVNVGSTLEFTVSASDGDGDPLIFSASGLPSGSTFNNSSRIFRWTPSASQKGTYSVSFKVSDGELNDYQTIAVTAREPSIPSPTGGSSGGGGSSSMSSGEEYENVEFKDYSIKYVMKDTATVYNFTKDNSIITKVILTTRLNGGQTKTIVETLKGTSTLVNKASPGIVYRNVNIWVGDEKFSPASISDASITFQVKKDWISGNSVEPASMKLLRYAGGAWSQLPTTSIDEDETYIYYLAKTPAFSIFAISSMDEKELQELSTNSGQGALQSEDDENGTMSADNGNFAATGNATQERKSSGILFFTILGITAVGMLGYRYRGQLGKEIAQLGNPDGKRYRRFKR
ncbi:putative Ig domain-containing protein [Methanolobus sp.]|uniref:putative Ig domain-containing protein n=1 Tax=Methanolobus sp. TaxID=1874737 RepID=UPI0025D81737|nr:putative Ig domain-containing protein [Methanolobus sp.]